MKTILLILFSLSVLSILFVAFTNIIDNLRDCKFRQFYNRHMVEFEEPIVFNHIKPVSLEGKIRVFSKWGNWLCDIFPDGRLTRFGKRSISEACEIVYIQENYSNVYKQLSK